MVEQHSGSSQPGEPLLRQQFPVPRQPEAGVHKGPHRSSASDAQAEPHESVQQDGMAVQTDAQHEGTSHPAPPCSAQQSPGPGHTTAWHNPPQRDCASVTHSVDQATAQQSAFSLQTASQQVWLLHARASCCRQQLSAPGQLSPGVTSPSPASNASNIPPTTRSIIRPPKEVNPSNPDVGRTIAARIANLVRSCGSERFGSEVNKEILVDAQPTARGVAVDLHQV